ncbi:MAG: sigma-54-dependent Fis family transcriptional regulator [Myxococcales bacterium]|nr:sigma-54-dependent Fis family transcriptional regulator [Myxococcales bacterium]
MPYLSKATRLLLVDDDVELCALLELQLSAKGHRDVALAHDVRSAVDLLGRSTIDAILLDLRLGREDGFDVLRKARQRCPEVAVLVLTADGSVESAVSAMRAGAFGYLLKPLAEHELLQNVAHAVEATRLRREVRGLRRIVGDDAGQGTMVGASPAIREVRDVLARLAPTDATVLILGESGTGKELAARTLHSLSPRQAGPFVAINCAALAPTLLESTLFGHLKGAFTGAGESREGLFAAARGGTLFLDEVGEASLEVQAKLLRVLETRKFCRVGSTREEETDARIVTATNRDLRLEVSEKRFREDLFYRLFVVPVSLPPLRDRAGDVPLLAELFLERAAARHKRAAPALGPEALAALSGHTWPGNVRELANAMEAAVLLARGGEVELDRLPGIGVASAPSRAVVDLDAALAGAFERFESEAGDEPPPLKDARDALERAYLTAVLRRAAGNVSVAARLAGRNRTDFYDLLRRHALKPAEYKH